MIATHGRGFYILNDVTPLQRIAAPGFTANLTLFPPMPVVRYMPASDTSVLGNCSGWRRISPTVR